MIGAVRKAWRWCRDAAHGLARRVGDWRDAVRPRLYRLSLVEGAMPDRLRLRTLYILTEDRQPWVASMICPCGCGQTLEMNLLTDERPCWRYSVDAKGHPSLEPSVWRKIGCRSHFFLRHGRIEWAPDTGRA
ncbi:DUF6527 family protein [Reyranella soli]|uniref:Uncharacterized protein n=1 Tax=Reyranella soli TaxID=1230389 RepID=A0A512NJ76_9HYPH|nr:DUF6527 family protein [Reyranella soli]GEP59004.1 hypothetical protein RSO01_61700 [Reyranella soli]